MSFRPRSWSFTTERYDGVESCRFPACSSFSTVCTEPAEPQQAITTSVATTAATATAVTAIIAVTAKRIFEAGCCANRLSFPAE